jgi:transposase, IS30 family
MDYTHLTRDERYQIQALRKAGLTRATIAAQLHRHPSTIGRELARGQRHCGYQADFAQSLARTRRLGSANAPRIDASAWTFAQARLAEQWSPEEISGHLRVYGLPGASPETLYRRIYADKRRGGLLWRQLRCRKKARKRYGQYDRRGRRCAPGAISIECRPAIVGTRTTVGHWEGDTMIDSYTDGALVSLVERKSGYTLLARVKRRSASLVCGAVTRLLTPFKQLAETLTLDNGKEFYDHQKISDALQMQCYFARPYASWQRGTNENTNGLIRQYFPKKRAVKSIAQSELRFVMHRLNTRPRKRLGYKTPNEVFMAALQSVALQG